MNHYASLFALLVAFAGVSGCSEIDKDRADPSQIKLPSGHTLRLEFSDALTESGLSTTTILSKVSFEQGQSPAQAISVYFIAVKEWSAKLIAKAYNSDNQEIGQAVADASFQSDDGKYVTFTFPSEMGTERARVIKIDLREKTTEGQD